MTGHARPQTARARILPTADRRAWLEAIEKRRGTGEADRLRGTMKALWEAKR